jgi:hypothetical protein
MKTYSLNKTKSIFYEKISLAGIPKGAYVLEINQNQEVYSQIIVK